MLHGCSVGTSGANCIAGGLLQPPPLQQSTGAAVTPAQSDLGDLRSRYNRGFHHSHWLPTLISTDGKTAGSVA